MNSNAPIGFRCPLHSPLSPPSAPPHHALLVIRPPTSASVPAPPPHAQVISPTCRRHACRWIDIIPRCHVGKPGMFISHAWSCSFVQLVRLVSVCERGGGGISHAWACCFIQLVRLVSVCEGGGGASGSPGHAASFN